MTQRVPQLLVTLSPEGELLVEAPGGGPTRKQVRLAPGEAGKRMLRMLNDQRNRIEREQVAERRARCAPKQPDWRLIAKHPEVEIRERIAVTVVPHKGGGLSVSTSRKSLEDLGL